MAENLLHTPEFLFKFPHIHGRIFPPCKMGKDIVVGMKRILLCRYKHPRLTENLGNPKTA